MNETSSQAVKLVSSRWARSLGFVQGTQTPRAHAGLDRAIPLAKRDLLHVARPAAPGVTLRKAHVVAKLRLLAANITSASHAVHPPCTEKRACCPLECERVMYRRQFYHEWPAFANRTTARGAYPGMVRRQARRTGLVQNGVVYRSLTGTRETHTRVNEVD